MGIFEKSRRHEIWNRTQHPYRHDLSDFGYANPSLPGITNVETAMNYILAVLYPNSKAAVNTQADLPPTGNSINDYRVVLDDGDGKQAAYRWEQREGEASASWHKVSDMDWSNDSILTQLVDVTLPLYFYKKGTTDIDGNGDPVTGLFAGQRVFGGDAANQNLTLNANSGDGTGVQTGFIQTEGNFRPTADATYNLSTPTERWLDGYFSNKVNVSTLDVQGGLITDSTGEISFDNENLSTTGNFSAGEVKGTSLVADNSTDTMALVPGSISDSTGAISFGAADLATDGSLQAGASTFTDGTNSLLLNPTAGTLTSTSGTVGFGSNSLVTTGNVNFGGVTATSAVIDSLFLNANALTTTAGSLVLDSAANLVNIAAPLTTEGITTTGTHTITGQLNADFLRLDGNTISNTNAGQNIIIDPLGAGIIEVGSGIVPTTDASFNLGAPTQRYNNLYLQGGLHDGANIISSGTILGFRSAFYRDLAQTIPAQDGDALFYNLAAGVYLASVPDNEVLHSTVDGLTVGDAGHTQFAMLTGRSGGQAIRGGTDANNDLILESTSSLTKGNILVRDSIAPESPAVFTTAWNGNDLGTNARAFRDVYTKGEFKGFRLENFTSGTLPAASTQNIGRVVYASDVNKAYVDTGSEFKVLGVSKFVADQVFDGTITQLDVTISASITDARQAQWQLMDNANNFEIMAVTLQAISATQVRIKTNVPLPAGSYRLIGVE